MKTSTVQYTDHWTQNQCDVKRCYKTNSVEKYLFREVEAPVMEHLFKIGCLHKYVNILYL